MEGRSLEGSLKVLRERANLRMVVAALGLAVSGLILLWISASFQWNNNTAAQSVVRDVGSFLSASAVLTFLWEFWGRRAFLDEVLAKVQLSDDIRSAGLQKIVPSFHTGINWQSYFPKVKELDILFAYGRTWRATHLEELQRLARKKGARIRVVLPDPDDPLTVGELARRFEYTTSELAKYVRDAVETFKELRTLAGRDGAEIDLWFFQGTQQFSYYRFDTIAIVALYTHRRARDPVPAIICEEGGSLFEFVRQDFDALVRAGGLARKNEMKEAS